MRKSICWSVLAVGAVIAALCTLFLLVPFSSKIDFMVKGIECRNNDPSQSFEEKEIAINGIYKRFLFKNKSETFSGTFSVTGYDFTFDSHATTSLIGGNTLEHIKFTPYERYSIGSIFCKPRFEEFAILVFEPIEADYGSWEGLVICAPASNRKEAIEIAATMCADIYWINDYTEWK